MEQEVITFKKAFEDLNRRANNSLFSFDGEKVIPLNSRIRLIFIDALNISGDFDFSFSPAKSLWEITKPKKQIIDYIRSSFERFVFVYYDPIMTFKKTIEDFVRKSHDTIIRIQEKKGRNG